MTNHWIDMINADVVLIMGGNPAEDHPIAMNWLTRTKERGAYILHVDPRFNRTSSIADVFAKLRSGTDIAFVGGMIRYAIEHNRLQQEYVREYTNASWIVGEGYDFTDGLFSGFDPKAVRYDRGRWAYALDAQGRPRRDPTLKHPRCVFRLLERHFARYDADTVCRITGTPKEAYLRICDIYTSTYAPDRAGTWLYAMGTAQHSHGTQNIRSYAILQLLLGNIGVAGGGVNAMRGESNVQGSTDQGLNNDILPGYLKVPVEADTDLATYLKRVTPVAANPESANWLQNTPKYVVSLLKAWWGEHARRENDFAFSYLPRQGAGFQGKGYAFLALTHAMLAGEIKGLFCFGQNPAVGGANARLIRAGLDKLEWMVVADLFEHETAGFWKRPGVDPAKIPTEVFVLPAASGVEKEGSIVNSGRWAQWRFRAVKPIADSRPDLDIVDGLAQAIRKAYAKDGVFPEPIRHLAWDYGHEPDPHSVARELNGRFLAEVAQPDGTRVAAGKQVPGFAQLRDDGSTMSGNWIYCGGYTEEGNLAARRDPADAANGIGLHPKWAWAWPMNRRILYNRASVNRKGEPFNPAPLGDPLEHREPDVGGRRARRRHAARGDEPLHHAGLGGRAALRPRAGGRAVPRALRAGRESRAQPAVQRAVHPLRAGLAVHGVRPLRHRRDLPHRRHHLPRLRALADRRHEPQHALAGGPGAARVRGDRHRAGRARGDPERRPGDREQRPGLHRGLRPRHRALPALLRRRPADRRDRTALALGLRGHRAR